jgi:hypothetical protein
MRKPPLSIMVIAALFLAVGGLDLYRGLVPLFQARLAGDDVLVFALGAAAVVGAVFLLYGRNWARWLLAAWMAFHVVVSFGHPQFQLIAHVVIFGLIAFALFRGQVAGYFRRPAGDA